MEYVHKLETVASEWYKNVPHLPKDVTTWIARNIWWITAILIVLGALGLLGTIAITFFAGALLSIAAGPVGADIGGLAMIAVLLSLALTVISLVIAGVAVKPLQRMQKYGWDLLFLLVVIEVISLALSLILTFNFFGAIFGLIWTALGLYVLFEIKTYFVSTERLKKKNEAQK